MTTSDYILIGTTLFLGLVAISAPVLSDLIKRWFISPSIKTGFELSPPFCQKTFWKNPKTPSLEEPVYFFRFRIENTGMVQLRQCEVVLERIWLFDSADNPQPIDSFSDINLRWSGSNNKFMDLNPARRAFCDIGHISSESYQNSHEKNIFIDVPGKSNGNLRFLLDQTEYPFSQPNSLLPGKYGMKISIYSENSSTKDLYFEFYWSGTWQDDPKNMFREAVLKRVKKVSVS